MADLSWLAFSMSLFALDVQVHGPPRNSTAFECSAGQGFQVEFRDRGRIAAVRTRTRNFLLPKKTGSFGLRFSSDEATLIIDGDLAAFVADEVNEYLQCQAAITPTPDLPRP